MKKLAAITALLALVTLTASAQSTRDQAVWVYDVPPGFSGLFFPTGGNPPLRDLRFVVGGHPDVRILAIISSDEDIRFEFNPGSVVPGATPSTVTQYFVRFPVSTTISTHFAFLVFNGSGVVRRVTVAARWE
ncbi:MAG: hypothetical protein HYY23_09125 [Verrucomicrobia bacterium]|nr:hypothetical protein [Verrucomicrobiota bacterium]